MHETDVIENRTRPAPVIDGNDRRQLKTIHVADILAGEYGPRDWQQRNDPLSELVETILSQHTSDTNSHRAFQVLQQAFPNWAEVRDAPVEQIKSAVRSAGLANIKAPRIQQVLRQIAPHGEPDLEHLRMLSLDSARKYLRALPGVGPKTAACVLLFSLGLPALPVDTHVYRVTSRLGLISPKITADEAHEVLEAMIPPERVYSFHIHLVMHGRSVCHSQRPAHEVCVLRPECDFWRANGASGKSPSESEPSGQ